jgi:large subunit ribosomal protein L6
MSRFGKLPVTVPQGVQISISDGLVVAKSSKGELTMAVPKTVKVEQSEEGLLVTPTNSSGQARADQGSTRSHLLNIVQGVTDGWKKKLEITGPGYRAEVRGKDLVISAGYSHPVNFPAPAGVSFSVEKSFITVEGNDKEVVGQTAAKIRDIRRPNVYTGTGIRYADEQVRRKAGKQAATKGE